MGVVVACLMIATPRRADADGVEAGVTLSTRLDNGTRAGLQGPWWGMAADPELGFSRSLATSSWEALLHSSFDTYADKLQSQYQPQLDALSKEGRAKFGFVEYDPPAFVVVSKQMVLQMTLKNTARFDPEKSSIYKRAAQTFDLFVAPKMKDVLDLIPSDLPVDYYDFSVVNTLNSNAGGKERSEAIEFLLPRDLARKFTNSDITNQELLDKGQVLINGVRIALNLQAAE